MMRGMLVGLVILCSACQQSPEPTVITPDDPLQWGLPAEAREILAERTTTSRTFDVPASLCNGASPCRAKISLPIGIE